MLRDSSASLSVVEVGLTVLTHDGGGGSAGGGGCAVSSGGSSGGDDRLLVLPESAGPREFIHHKQPQQAQQQAQTQVTASGTSVLLLEAFIKDADQEDMVEHIPSLQYYRADRVATVHTTSYTPYTPYNTPS